MKEWIVGRNPVYELLQAKRRDVFRLLVAAGVEEKGRIREILSLAAARKIAVERVPRERLSTMGENPQGVALEVSAYPYVDLNAILERAAFRGEAPFILILDIIQNPQNLGTLLRSAEAAGMHGVIIPLRRAADVTPAVVSASAGASEHMLIAQENLARAIELLKKRDVWVVGLEGSEEAKEIGQVPLNGPLALVVGNEGEGMRLLIRESCDFLLKLPMHGRIESLNAAVAGSIVIYQAVLARKQQNGGG
ncbi:MAG: 23S rRNA (guanosine(2251)-2'-O)-methyltransferase RlmB [Anaerolineaceae bacterium]